MLIRVCAIWVDEVYDSRAMVSIWFDLTERYDTR